MPSLFKSRRASETLPAVPVPDDSHLTRNRRSVDLPPPASPPSRTTPSKLKSLLRSGGGGGGGGETDEPNRNNNLRKRLSSASQIFGGGAENGMGSGSGSNDDGKRNSLRHRLSNASQIFGFGSGHPETAAAPTRPRAASASASHPMSPADTSAALDRYQDPAPRSPRQPNAGAQFASPTLFPENFSLSGTSSPEAVAAPSGAGRRGSVSWQPSYPTVVDEGNFADVPPDGSLPMHRVGEATSPVATVSENARRRSRDMGGLESPGEALGTWPALEPSKPKDKEMKADQQVGTTGDADTTSTRLANGDGGEAPQMNGLSGHEEMSNGNGASTQPKGADEPKTEAKTVNGHASDPHTPSPLADTPTSEPSPTSRVDRPSLSLKTSPAELQAPSFFPALAPNDNAETSPHSSTTAAQPSGAPVSTPVSATATTRSPDAPVPVGLVRGPNGKLRPDMPMRRSTLIQSPPMPQPIRNLPTLQGLQGLRFESGPTTPSWGALAREGGPKTPGGFFSPRTPGGMMGGSSAQTPRTPGAGGGFPWMLAGGAGGASAGAGGKDKSRERSGMTEEELRKAKRAMPVMLRQPSTLPARDEGGDVGNSEDEDSDDSETEMEVTAHGEDDSEGETETERAAQASTPGGMLSAMSKGLLAGNKARFAKGKGKVKTKAGAGVSPVAKTTIQEEPDSPPVVGNGSGPSSPTRLADRRPQAAAPPRLSNLSTSLPAQPPAGSSTPNKGFWSLPTPTTTRGAQTFGSWTKFGSSSPAPTPKATVAPSVAARTESYASTISERSSEGYFGSQASGSVSTNSVQTMQDEPSLLRDAGSTAPPAAALLGGLGLGAPITDHGEEADASDEEEDGSEDMSSQSGHGHGSGSAESPGVPVTTTTTTATVPQRQAPARPAIYSRPSKSMVDLSTPSRDPTAEAAAETQTSRRPSGERASEKPQLATIPSREAVPNRIELPPRSPLTSMSNGNVPMTPAEWAKPPPTPAAGLGGNSYFWGGGAAKGGETPTKVQGQTPLKRRRSADDMQVQPPKYEPPAPGLVLPRPRDEEGREKLPGYWCAVHIEGAMSRKLEFSGPGIQSRDRSWKKLYFILRGTSLLVYKFDPHRFPVKDDHPAPIPIVTEDEADGFLHVHVPGERRASVSAGTGAGGGRRGSVDTSPSTSIGAGARRGSVDSPTPVGAGGRRPSASGPTPFVGQNTSGTSVAPSSASRRTSVGSSPLASSSITASDPGGEKDAYLFNQAGSPRRGSISAMSSATGASGSSSSSSVGPGTIASHFQQNHLIRQYTMQHAESGLAADYVKRKNVVRVRAEGEQFLLQTENAREVVDWIEAFQAASNVALDLDERPMPKIITLPRRRRRRPAAAGASGATATGTNTPTSAATAAVAAPTAAPATTQPAERDRSSSARRQMEDLLQEDQRESEVVA